MPPDEFADLLARAFAEAESRRDDGRDLLTDQAVIVFVPFPDVVKNQSEMDDGFVFQVAVCRSGWRVFVAQFRQKLDGS